MKMSVTVWLDIDPRGDTWAPHGALYLIPGQVRDYVVNAVYQSPAAHDGDLSVLAYEHHIQ